MVTPLVRKPVSSSAQGEMTEGAQTLPGAKTWTGVQTFQAGFTGQPLSNIRSSDADVTLTIADAVSQTFTGLTVSRTVTLPTTGVNAGDVWRLENTTAFDLVVRSSNGTALTVANGANVDATHQRGFVLLRSLQANPTTPAHWLVVDLYEVTFQANASASGNFTNVGTRFTRRMNNVLLTATENWFVANNTITQDTGSGYIITRMRPSIAIYFAYRSGTGATWSAQILTTGVMRYAGNGSGGTSVDSGSFSWNVA